MIALFKGTLEFGIAVFASLVMRFIVNTLILSQLDYRVNILQCFGVVVLFELAAIYAIPLSTLYTAKDISYESIFAESVIKFFSLCFILLFAVIANWMF